MAGPVLVGTQKNSGSASGTTVTVTLAGAITAGNLLVAIAAGDNATVPGTTAISDTTGSNVWTRLSPTVNNGVNGSVAVFVCLSAAAGSYGIKFTHTVSFVALSVAEFSPTAQSGTDGTNTGTGASGTVNSGTVTTANANDSILVGASCASVDVTWAAGTGYTLLSCVNSSANTTVGAQYQSFSTTVSGQATAFGNTAGSGWEAVATAVMAVAAGGAGPVLQDLMHRPGFMPLLCM